MEKKNEGSAEFIINDYLCSKMMLMGDGICVMLYYLCLFE